MKALVLAGEGLLPLEAVRSLKEKGREVAVVAFDEPAPVDLQEEVDGLVFFSLSQVGKVLSYIKHSGASELVFAGKFSRRLLEKNIKFDIKALWMLARLKDRQEDTIMKAITAEIETMGVKVLSQLEVLARLAAAKGIYSRRKPTRAELDDIDFGFEKGKGIAGLDIGQSIIVKKKSVIAVEAIEGTDLSIVRAGELTNNGGFTFVKVAKPMQDYRFDMPVIGMRTLKLFAEAKGAVLALEANSTLILDFEDCVKFADENGFVFMAV